MNSNTKGTADRLVAWTHCRRLRRGHCGNPLRPKLQFAFAPGEISPQASGGGDVKIAKVQLRQRHGGDFYDFVKGADVFPLGVHRAFRPLSVVSKTKYSANGEGVPFTISSIRFV